MYVLSAIVCLTLLGLVLGLLLGIAAKYLKVESSPILDEVESLLPGSQCGQCGFPGCRPAAEALVEGNVAATICPPGGSALAEQLAALLGLDLDLSAVKEPELLVGSVKPPALVARVASRFAPPMPLSGRLNKFMPWSLMPVLPVRNALMSVLLSVCKCTQLK